MWILKHLFLCALLPLSALSASYKEAFTLYKEAFTKFKEYKDHEWLTDFTIVDNEGGEHHCHKLILSLASKYFQIMLASKMKESIENISNLPYAKDTITITIEFIYDLDKTSINKDITWDIYVELKEFANILFIDRLKQAIAKAKIILPTPEELLKAIDYIFSCQDIDLADHLLHQFSIMMPIYKFKDTPRFSCPSFSPDGKLMVTTYDNTAKIWNLISGEELIFLNSHKNYVNYVSFSHDARFIVTTSYDKTAKIWDIFGNNIQTFTHIDTIYMAAFNADDKSVVTVAYNNIIKIWDVTSGEVIKSIDRINYTVYPETIKALSSDGQLAVSVSEHHFIKIWDLTLAKDIATINDYTITLMSHIIFSNDNKFIAISFFNIFKIYEIASGQITTFNHDNMMDLLAFSPDNRLIFSVSNHKNITIWNLTTNEEIITTESYYKLIDYIFLNPYTQSMVTISNDRIMTIWIISPVQFYHHELLFNYDKEEAKSWLMLQYLLITYMDALSKDERPTYENFVLHASSLMNNDNLAKFILAHENLLSYFRYLFKDFKI